MSFRYCCFISYRNRDGDRDVAERLASALRNELGRLLPDAEVFRDADYIAIGDELDPNLATAICESVCMLVIYTPTTYEADHTYCAREYAAMVALEQTRLAAMDGAVRPSRGPILTLPFRGARWLPAELKARAPYDFNGVREDLRSPEAFSTVIPDIAEDIVEWCSVLGRRDVPPNAGDGCEGFALPPADHEVARRILDQTRTVAPRFPGR